MGATTEKLRPPIYVSCLAAYNQGYLHGEWIDAAQEPWTIWDAVKERLAASPVAGAEEWAIHDYEGFGALRIGESAGLDNRPRFRSLAHPDTKTPRRFVPIGDVDV